MRANGASAPLEDTKQELLRRIADKQAIIGIVGLGYVGLPLMIRFSEAGFPVVGFDIDTKKIAQLNAGRSYIGHIPSELIAARVGRAAKSQTGQQVGLFRATDDFSQAAQMDALILCVPTPLNRQREPDLQFVRGTIESLLPYMRTGQIVSLESTTYPGTTEEELQSKIEGRGLEVGSQVFVVYSPEREDPGNKTFNTQNTPKVCGGITEECLDVGVALYSQIISKVVPVSSTRAAEMTKLLENIYRAVNIGLVNELKTVADRMGIDIREVIDAAATKPFGFTPFFPGPGLGGHCIPIDPFYLTWKAREYGVNTRFVELAGEVNRDMPRWVVSKTVDALNERGKPLKGSHMLVLGLAYKKNVDDSRESPAAEIIEILRAKGANVDYSDPFIPLFPEKRDYHLDLKSVALDETTVEAADCVLIVTDHDGFPYEMILEKAQLIVDTRGVYRGIHPNVVHA